MIKHVTESAEASIAQKASKLHLPEETCCKFKSTVCCIAHAAQNSKQSTMVNAPDKLLPG